VRVRFGTCGSIWVFMGMWGFMRLGNGSTCGLALVCGETYGLVLYFHWLRGLVMELRIGCVSRIVGTCGSIWVHMVL
jgi:hypothetical protein